MASLTRQVAVPGADATALWFAADGWVPNNTRLPVIFYRSAIGSKVGDPAAAFEETFRRHGWPPEWRNGVYPFHHYHSTAHEVLGFAEGSARLILGGPHGHEITVNAGDCALLPAGTGHCRIDCSGDFLVVGAYPPNQNWDLCRGAISEAAIARMLKITFPRSDPVSGTVGPLLELWTPPE
jgi:uncharacterized protein YjlB